MTLVMPILLASIMIGLFVPKMNRFWWMVLGIWIALMIISTYLKPTTVPIPGQSLNFRSLDARQIRQA